MFNQPSAYSTDGFENSGADFLSQYKKYILDGTVIASLHKVYGPQQNDEFLKLLAGERRSLSVLPLDHRQRVERVLPPSINRQFHEPSMKARARPRGGDSRDKRPREAEPS